MWRDYFKLKGLRPGRVITELCGEIDFSRDNLPVETVKKLYENDFPYLELTERGKAEIYGIIPEKRLVETILPVAEPEEVKIGEYQTVKKTRNKSARKPR